MTGLDSFKKIAAKSTTLAVVFFVLPVYLFGITIDPGNKGNDTIIFKGSSIKLGGSPTASDGLAPYKYEWKSDKGGFTSTESNPTATPTETTVFTVTVEDADGFKCDKSVKVIVIEIKIKKLEFKSDHNLMCDGADVLTPGSRFPDIEWDPGAGPAVNAPITHTAGAAEKITIELTLEIKELPANTKCKLMGTSPESSLNFEKEENLSAGSDVKISITGTNPIKEELRKFESSIAWKISIKSIEKDLGPTGPHKVFTTVGVPDISGGSGSTKPNVSRMELSVPRVKDAVTATGKLCYPGIVWELNKKNGAYNLAKNLPGEIQPWLLPSTPGGADCISISTFVRNVCKVMGIPGTFNADTYFALYRTAADPARPNKALIGSLSSPIIVPGSSGAPLTGGLDPSWELVLADVNCKNLTTPAAPPGTVGCGPGGLNNFEASVIYTLGAKTYYIPGGTSRIYDNKDHIVQIFQTLAWCAPTDHDSDVMTPDVFIIKAVDFTYTIKPNIVPCP